MKSLDTKKMEKKLYTIKIRATDERGHPLQPVNERGYPIVDAEGNRRDYIEIPVDERDKLVIGRYDRHSEDPYGFYRFPEDTDLLKIEYRKHEEFSCFPSSYYYFIAGTKCKRESPKDKDATHRSHVYIEATGEGVKIRYAEGAELPVRIVELNEELPRDVTLLLEKGGSVTLQIPGVYKKERVIRVRPEGVEKPKEGSERVYLKISVE